MRLKHTYIQGSLWSVSLVSGLRFSESSMYKSLRESSFLTDRQTPTVLKALVRLNTVADVKLHPYIPYLSKRKRDWGVTWPSSGNYMFQWAWRDNSAMLDVTKKTTRRWQCSQRETKTVTNSYALIRRERITYKYTRNNNNNYNILYIIWLPVTVA